MLESRAKVGLGESWKGKSQETAGVVVPIPIRCVGEGHLLLVDRDVADGDVGVAHGTGDELAIAIADEEVLGWGDGAVPKVPGALWSKATSHLGNDEAHVVDALKVTVDGPGVGAARVEEKGHCSVVPEDLGGVLCAKGRRAGDVLVAKAAYQALVSTQDDGHRLGIGPGGARPVHLLCRCRGMEKLGCRRLGMGGLGSCEADADGRRVDHPFMTRDGCQRGFDGKGAAGQSLQKAGEEHLGWVGLG